MDDISRTVKEFVLESFLKGESPDALTETTPLIAGGILDSLATLELVSFLETRYGVEFQAHEIDASRLGTIRDIANLMQAKLAEKV